MFGSGGGAVVAKKWEVPLIAELPLSLDIREKMDSGDPIVSRNVQHQSAGIFRSAARKISANLWGSKPDLPTISLVSD
jgi:ATP-binding protein involved in chromosome partitioning